MAFEGGPYVKAAVFVNQVIEGKDNVLSLIRVIDRLVTTASGPAPPQNMPVASLAMHAVIMFVPGRARGRHQIRLVREAPNADRIEVWSGGILFEGENKGHNVNLALNETFSLEGVYWYDVFVDDGLVTRMPFQVVYQPMSRR
jgi:hypothetical protein